MLVVHNAFASVMRSCWSDIKYLNTRAPHMRPAEGSPGERRTSIDMLSCVSSFCPPPWMTLRIREECRVLLQSCTGHRSTVRQRLFQSIVNSCCMCVCVCMWLWGRETTEPVYNSWLMWYKLYSEYKCWPSIVNLFYSLEDPVHAAACVRLLKCWTSAQL